MTGMLWFDVEKRYNTTRGSRKGIQGKLWLDVEKRYNTTYGCEHASKVELWFDVEKRYNTTGTSQLSPLFGCALM